MRFALLTGAVVGAMIGLAIEVVDSSRPRVEAADVETYKQLNLFGEIFDRVKENYVSETSDKELINAAINGMLSKLDPHSAFLDAESFKAMRIQTKGEFGGLGIEVGMENGLVKVISPIDDTPAARAGMKSGDLIVKLDDAEVMGLTLREAVDLMRGEVGSSIRLSVKRPGVEDLLEITIVRDVIRLRPVRHRVEDDIGYVRVVTFNEHTTEELEKATADLIEKIGLSNLKGFVLDLRNNPGGLLNQAVQVSDAFLERGDIVSTRGREKDSEVRYAARRGDISQGKPLVVLVNGGSASASEIVAGALQDHGRALILGTKTFGKGSVQTIIPVGPQGALKLTTGLYYTPSGRSIQAAGIIPDLEIEQGRLETNDNGQKPRKEADLRGRLDNPDGDAGQPVQPKDDQALDEKNDYQLTYALNLLRGLSKLK
ncbi:MAG: S41 family peptidase [Alphaproteobacteria bacterium]